MLSNLLLNSTQTTPKIEFTTSGYFKINGISLSENSKDFFEPLLAWVDRYCLQAPQKTEVNMFIEYLDSGSLGYFNLLLQKLNELHKSGKSEVTLKWKYEEDDGDMEDYGEDIKSMYDFNVKLFVISLE